MKYTNVTKDVNSKKRIVRDISLINFGSAWVGLLGVRGASSRGALLGSEFYSVSVTLFLLDLFIIVSLTG